MMSIFNRITGLRPVIVAMAMAGALTVASAGEPGTGGELSLDVDARLFVRDNEFSLMMKGYTLPGFRLAPTLSYSPSAAVKISAGAYMLHYWGSDRYPDGNYTFIPEYSGHDNSRGVHALPYLRVQATAPCGVTFVLGNLLNHGDHGMLPQLYSRELGLTADPEAGFQMLYSRPWGDFDLWLDWRSFIYNGSPYRENFFVGLSSRFRFNSEASPVHFYAPLQALVEHRGGEIDTNEIPGVNTLANGALGLGMTVNTCYSGLRSVTLEADMLASYQQAGAAWPYDKGWAAYAHAEADFYGIKADVGYYRAHQYLTVLGLPLWGVASTATPGMLVKDPSTAAAGLSYEYEYARGFSIKADMQLYHMFGADCINGVEPVVKRSATNFAIGVTFVATPSFLLKRFGRPKY